jgi:hypothetical protein
MQLQVEQPALGASLSSSVADTEPVVVRSTLTSKTVGPRTPVRSSMCTWATVAADWRPVKSPASVSVLPFNVPVTDPEPVIRPTMSALIGTGERRALKGGGSCVRTAGDVPRASAKSKIPSRARMRDGLYT